MNISEYINAKPGDKISFGRYPQIAEGVKKREGIIKISLDDHASGEGNAKGAAKTVVLSHKSEDCSFSGKDILPIEWIVLENNDGELLLLSVKILDYLPFHTSEESGYYLKNWQYSTLRNYLNTKFYSFAFSDEEKRHILTTLCTDNSSNKPRKFIFEDYREWADGAHGKKDWTEKELRDFFDADESRGKVADTYDKVFLLSWRQAETLGERESRIAFITDFGRKRAGNITSQFDDNRDNGFPWWLRSTQPQYSNVSSVIYGHVRDSGTISHHKCGVRPAIRISVNGAAEDSSWRFTEYETFKKKNDRQKKRALKLYETAKDYYLGRNGKEQNHALAGEHFMKAAEAGHGAAYYAMQQLYDKQRNYQGKKPEWKLRDRKKYNYKLEYYDAVSWYEGDPDFSVWCYERLADGGNVDAMYCLGYMHYRPHKRGEHIYFETTPKTDEEYSKTFYWLTKAAEFGKFEAQMLLAQIYEGDCAKADQEKALYWYTKAVENKEEQHKRELAEMRARDASVNDWGEGWEYGKMQYNIACMYADGRGTEKDAEKAFYWCRKACENDYRGAHSLYVGLGKEKALQIARKAHEGQKDKCGVDYIEHPIAVAAYCDSGIVKTAALLHDVVEDSDITLEALREAGIDDEIVKAVDCLTKRSGEGEDVYFARLAADGNGNRIAAAVKFADMRHNSDKSRWPTDKQDKAEENYQKYHGRAMRLFSLIGKEKARELMTDETYKWLMGKSKWDGTKFDFDRLDDDAED